jgi:hypothetical protein
MHRKIGLALAASVAAVALALAVATSVGVGRYDQTFDTGTWYAENFSFVAYHDLDGRPAFKMAMLRPRVPGTR